MERNGLCTFASGDIEDIARERCRDYMNNVRSVEKLEPRQFPVSSP
jgi:hypothetical protein